MINIRKCTICGVSQFDTRKYAYSWQPDPEKIKCVTDDEVFSKVCFTGLQAGKDMTGCINKTGDYNHHQTWEGILEKFDREYKKVVKELNINDTP
jgi:hypothetical protein